MKKISAVVLAIVLAISACLLTGCGLSEVNQEVLGKKVVATVNGEDIVRSEWFVAYYQNYLYYSQYYSSLTETQLQSIKESTLESLIIQKIWIQKAKAEGYFNFTDEMRAAAKVEVEKDIEDAIQSQMATLKKDAKEGEEHDDAYYRAQAEKDVKESMETNGQTLESLTQSKLESNALDNYKADQLKDIKALEADILTKYDTLLKEQKTSFGVDSDDDKKDYAAYVKAKNDGTTVVVYNLDGYYMVQHILISYDDANKTKVSAAAADVTTAQTALDTLKTAYDKLTDETEKAAKQTEIDAAQKTLDEKKAAYDAARKTAEEASKAAADEVYNSVKGADEDKFIEVMLDKTGDTGMNTQETAEKGYLVGNEDGMVTEFHDAAVKLEKDGDITEPVATDYGFHIIRRLSAIKEGALTSEEAHDEIEKSLTEEKQTTEWNNMQTEWRKVATVTINKKWMGDF